MTRSDGASVEVVGQAEANTPGADRSLRFASRTIGERVANALVRPSGVVIPDVGFDQVPQLTFTDDEEPIQAFSPHRADEPFSVGVEVGTGDTGGMIGDSVATIFNIRQFRPMIMNEVYRSRTVLGKQHQLLGDKGLGRVFGDAPLNDQPGLEFLNEEDKEAFTEGRIDR